MRLGIGWEDCGHSEKVYDADFIVVSPGGTGFSARYAGGVSQGASRVFRN